MARRIAAHTLSRRKRAKQLEEVLGFELIRKMDERRPKMMFAPSVNRSLDLVAWVTVIAWLAYLVVFICRGV